MHQLAKNRLDRVPVAPALPTDVLPGEDKKESLFEHAAWLYALCREKLFRDDTQRMIAALWPERSPSAGTKLIEFGCGPGFYSCQFAAHFPELAVTGVDSSEAQLTWARTKKLALKLSNCGFECGDVLALNCTDESYDALIASRLFTILPQRNQAVAEMHRILRSGGRAFVAEPRHRFRANVPLMTMRLLAGLTRFRAGYREPGRATVLSMADFESLFATQPWRDIRVWQDGRYQYALCEKR